MNQPILKRIVLSVALFIVTGWVNFLLNPIATVLSGAAAGQQFDNSNASYLKSVYETGIFGHLFVSGGVVFVLLLAIWWKYLPSAWAKITSSLAIVSLFVASVGVPIPARAYYDKTDYAEAVMIMPNESAFWIPDTGANKDNQAKFGSTEYYDANKVAAKRFVIPHAKFSGSGFWSDFYVPTGRLILVDRTPYNREWTSTTQRGTSSKNESFPCQSQEGVNIAVEVAIASSVREEDAAKFLYWFGVNAPAGDRSQPNVIFTSVYYGRSLAQVMDTVGRGKVQALVCKEIGARTFDKANADVNAIMDAVEKATAAFLQARGITLDYIGWAGTFTFDDSVQKAVNDKYVAASLAASLPTLQALADVKVKEGLGDGLRTKGLPASLIAFPDRLLGARGSMFGKAPEAKTAN